MRKKKLKLWDVNVKLQAYNLPVQDINSIVRKKSMNCEIQLNCEITKNLI